MQGTIQKKSNWIKKILRFPFVLTGFLLKTVTGILLAAVLIVIGYSLYRSTLPMTLPEAQGMSYQNFFKDRLSAIRDIPDRSDACFKSTFFLLPMYVLRTSGIPALISVYYPGGKTDLWLQKTDVNYAYLLPRGDPKLSNLFPLYWEAVERSSWAFLVTGVSHARTCSSVRPVTIIPSPGG